MMIYISILRGINVGGQKKLRMNDLKALYEDLGFEKVVTFIQSGNVIFQSGEKTPPADLSLKIEHSLKKKFGFEISVILRTVDEMQKITTNNPFLEFGEEKLHVTLLSDYPKSEFVTAIGKFDYSPDRFILIGKEIYLYCPDGYGRIKLANNLFENKLKVKASTRNWRTLNKLVAIATSKS